MGILGKKAKDRVEVLGKGQSGSSRQKAKDRVGVLGKGQSGSSEQRTEWEF